MNNPTSSPPNILTEKQLEFALSASRTHSNLYSLIMILLFTIASIGGFISLSSIPLLFYEPKYLCKETPSSLKYTIECTLDFICDKRNTINQDYILEQSSYLDFKSFTTLLNIQCNQSKKIWWNTAYFIGGTIGMIIIPFLISFSGCLNSIIIGYAWLFFSSCFLSFIKVYSITVIWYVIFTISLSIFVTAIPHYIVEMINPKQRAFYICILFLSFGISGYFSVWISYYSKDCRAIISFSAGVALIFGCTIKIFLVDSIRTSFIQGKNVELWDSWNYIARINKSTLEFKVWKEENLGNESQSHRYSGSERTFIYNTVNKYKDINYFNIWKYPSQVKIIFLFSFTCFTVNYSIMLVQLEITKQDNFFNALAIGYTCDIVGSIIGCFLAEINYLKRKYSFIGINVFLFFAMLLGGVFYKEHYIFSFMLMRVGTFALFSNYNLYNFEIYPTLTRPVCVCVNRIFGRVLNLWAPYVLIKHQEFGYYLGMVFVFLIVAMMYGFNVQETKGEVMKEFPPEFGEEEIISGKSKEDFWGNEDESEAMNKKK